MSDPEKPPSLTPPAETPKKVSRKTVLRMGVVYAGLMWLFMSVAPNIKAAATGHPINWHQILNGLVTWSLAGAFYALWMKWTLPIWTKWALSKKKKASQPPVGG
jgi:hypothetical protein